MSDFKVPIVAIDKIEAHPNADRLEMAYIAGWVCVVGKGQFKSGDLAVYIPVDSILPDDIEKILFPPDSKITLDKHRIRSIKIRGSLSQGLLILPESIGIQKHKITVNKDYAEELGITKYEPPTGSESGSQGQIGRTTKNKTKNPYFKEYTDISNFKWYPNLFEGELVVITEKVHGSNFRAGWVPRYQRNWFDKLLVKLKIRPKWEFVYGSRRVQLQIKAKGKGYKGYYPDNVYLEAVKKYNLKSTLQPGEVVYGEVYGDGIQKNYTYGCTQGERKLALFDLQILDASGKSKLPTGYENYDAFIQFLERTNLPAVPQEGVCVWNEAAAKRLANTHPSVLCPGQKVKEGVVIKCTTEKQTHAGRSILKLISDAYYLDKSNSDFH